MAVITFIADATTLILNGTPVTDFATGDTVTLTPVNNVTEHINGINNSVSITKRADGGVHDLKIRVIQGSDSDVFLNTIQEQSSVVVINGSVKENFVKDGADGVDSYILENGSFTTRPTHTKNNTDGGKILEYTIRFRNASRSI